MKREVLRLERVTYAENNMVMLENLNFQMFEGEIMGLVPLRSNGVEALLHLLIENRPLVYGYVYIRERPVNSGFATRRRENNIFVISTESNLVKHLSTAENVFALRRGYKAFFLQNSVFVRELQKIFDELALDMRAVKKLDQMTPFEIYIIEIIKAVISRADIIILRDPGSVLSPEDIEVLDRVLRYYREAGFSFIYISHHPDELGRMCNRIAFMRDGSIIKIIQGEELDDQTFSLYTGPEIPDTPEEEESSSISHALWCLDAHYKKIKGLTFRVRRRECMVIRDEDACLKEDFLNVLLDPGKLTEGTLCWGSKTGNGTDPRRIGIILESPEKSMIFPDMSIEDNLCIAADPGLHSLWQNKQTRENVARTMLGEEFAVSGRTIMDLSNKEKYRIVYTRILLQRPDVVVCVHPYDNIDMDLKEYINGLIREFRKHQIAVLILTLNIQDAYPVADRIVFVKDGRQRAVLGEEELQKLKDDQIGRVLRWRRDFRE